MTEAQAIEFLQDLGYVVTKPEGNLYLSHGETWENDPKLYRGAWNGNKAAYSALLDAAKVEVMVSRWSDATLRSVVEFGTDLAFNKSQRVRIQSAVRAEWERRHTATPRATNGMVE